jgi:hypothetical protein
MAAARASQRFDFTPKMIAISEYRSQGRGLMPLSLLAGAGSLSNCPPMAMMAIQASPATPLPGARILNLSCKRSASAIIGKVKLASVAKQSRRGHVAPLFRPSMLLCTTFGALVRPPHPHIDSQGRAMLAIISPERG